MTVKSRRPSPTARLGLLVLGFWIAASSHGALCWGAATDPPAPAGAGPGNPPASGGGQPKPADPASGGSDLVATLNSNLVLVIDDLRITFKVDSLDDEIIVALHGDVDTESERDQIVDRVSKAAQKTLDKDFEKQRKAQNEAKKTQKDSPKPILKKLCLRDRIVVKNPGSGPSHPASTKEPKAQTELWVLTYIHSSVQPTVSGSTAPTTPSSPEAVDVLVDSLNALYASADVPVVQRAGLGRLLLTGTQEQIIRVKRLLAVIDAPLPQVQLNMWAIQVSGEPKDISGKVRIIGQQVRAVRDQMAEVQQELAKIVVRSDPEAQAHWKELDAKFAHAGIDLPHDGTLSLNESLIFLTLDPNRAEKVKALRGFVKNECERWVSQQGAIPKEIAALGCSDPKLVPFGRLADLFATSSYADRQSFSYFGQALHCFNNSRRALCRPDAPRDLIRTGATVDRVLKTVMDAFSADMNDLFLDPLLERIEAVQERGKGDVALVGRTRIVVTSGLEAGLAPEMASFVESGRPKPFGKDLLDLAFPSSEAGSETKKDVLTGANKVLAGLVNGQALALAALLNADTEPAYTKVAPGIAVNVRPTVLPDGGAARLTLDARFGVASTPLDTGRTDIWRQAPPAGIASHDVRTDAVVSAFDLFDISSFSVEASHPQTPFYIPILGRLPLIGPAFQIPRHDKTTHFESLVLVNTVILPRSIELHRFYGFETEQSKGPEEDCREVAPLKTGERSEGFVPVGKPSDEACNIYKE